MLTQIQSTVFSFRVYENSTAPLLENQFQIKKLTLDKIIIHIKLHTAPEVLAICKARFENKGFAARGRYTRSLYTITPNMKINTSDTYKKESGSCSLISVENNQL